ncbi:hypothetical protein GlitD10_0187 [Gloeomargarita lithophora Alchichica-D10]|uniref:Ribbon-helix-helix protein CopG domain-containing protein n=1 Tax=Gloeomargarita lithophora Alchichica-D10 TaxID=1188229 RepID=A0A1J0A973_9CYAN|nr:ribbon-helix-helix domain-containing protein [Gloeomargarita lithophora]APB32488.1 hypothetical protein GlitD10_0187 [Gloeomargarita lithophora Alchichica-D10]
MGISGKRRVTVTIDANLLNAIDQASDNRSAVVEAALRLWQATQVEKQLTQFYQNRSPADRDTEVEWAQATQQSAIASWPEDTMSSL